MSTPVHVTPIFTIFVKAGFNGYAFQGRFHDGVSGPVKPSIWTPRSFGLRKRWAACANHYRRTPDMTGVVLKLLVSLVKQMLDWPRGYKTFFMLNSAELEILDPHKY